MHPSISLFSLLPAVVNVDATFDFTQHLGIVTPPFTPSFGLAGGLGSGMPSVCSLEQVQVVSAGCMLTLLTYLNYSPVPSSWLSIPGSRRLAVNSKPLL